MIKQFNSLQQPSLQLCSRCLYNEVNSWVNEKWIELNEEIKKQIREELKTIKLRNGNCVVCNHNLVSDGTSEKILEILKEGNIPEKTKKEFKKFFIFSE